MKNLSYLILSILFLSLLTSCSNNDDSAVEPEQTIEELLTSHDWTKESVSYTDGGQDVTNQIDLIFQDLFISFNDDGTYSITSSNLGVLSSGTWSINEAGDTITVIDQDSNTIIINILELTETSLHVTFTYISEGYITINVDIDVTLVPDTI